MLPPRLRPISEEFEGAKLGDQRLSRRLAVTADAIAAMPAAGLPSACRTDAALEGAYRLLSNERVSLKKILEPHLNSTCDRARDAGDVLVIHDTTEFAFSGETRRHLGRTNSNKPGFFAHVSLAVRLDNREPLGLLACRTWARHHKPTTKAERGTREFRERPEKESNRWGDAVDEVEERYQGGTLIHVADREADQYRLMVKISERGSSFIVRSANDRVLTTPEERLWTMAANADVVFEREVYASRRRPIHKRATHGPRDARVARLAVSATSVELKRAKVPANRGLVDRLKVNVVRVVEVDPPAGEEPIEWILQTNLPIDTQKDIEVVIDGYRTRWLVEEFFKAVKSGCAYEKAQLENPNSLENLLAIVLPIAWQMLLLRHLARSDSKAPAKRVFSSRQIDVLGNSPWTTLPKRPTVSDAMRAVATMGGHIRNNGEPGWQVLYRGFRTLMLLEVGWARKK